jgi:uncharacterized protein
MKKLIPCFLLLLAIGLKSQVPPRPQPPRLYNNLSKEFPDFLSAPEAAALEEKLEQFSNETSNQICVVIVDDLAGMDASSYAFMFGNEWGVGKKNFNNGIVVLVKPTGNAGGRDLFIATGYGLEVAIPDLMTSRIREQEMEPYLKRGENYTALDHGTTVLMQLAKGEISEKDFRRAGKRQSLPAIAIIIIIIVIIILKNLFGGGGGGRTLSRTGSALFWGSMLGGGFGRGGSGGLGGGSSGGGWGGFGGGGFGGGGSGGKW